MTSSNRRRARARTGIVAGLLALCVLAVSCGGGGGSNNSNTSGSSIAQQIATCTQGLPALAVPTTGNSVPVILDAGPCAYGVPFGSPAGTASSVFVIGAANVPYTSVTICTPGTTSCQTIDHILVDTGSSGLRLMSSVLSSGVVLPAVTIGAAPLIECIQFADGYSWGSMRRADVHLAGETASNIPVQVIGDASSYAVPATCSSTSKNVLNDAVSFGANGVLGVGVFAQDCGPGCVTAVNNTLYYACPTTSSCGASTAPLADQATNPVYAFNSDFNGLLLQFPAVAEGTGALNLKGSLIFGIGSQANNMPATVSPNAHIYIADGFADFNTNVLTVTGPYTVTTSTYSNSFIDSGSNGIYIPGTTITPDATSGWFIPTAPAAGGNPADVITLTATQQGAGAVGNLNSLSFKIANANTVLFPSGNGINTVFNGLGATNSGTGSTGGVDWGLPFFLGKSIFVGIEGSTITLGNGENNIGPLWAY